MNLPYILVALPQWVNYRLELKADGSTTKIPYRADGRGKASSTDHDTWRDFESAQRAVTERGFDGIGFVFTLDSGIVGIDLDHCIDMETGEIALWAQDIVSRLDSYTELSPSKTGLHIYCTGVLPAGRRRKDGIEMYDSGRFFTVTGAHYPGSPLTVEARTEAIAALHAELFPPKPLVMRPAFSMHIQPDDSVLLDKARNAKNGSQFAALFDRGDTSGQGGDDSRSDLALAGSLVYWTGGDCDRAERLFGQSALGQRDKWQRADYRQRTFKEALEGRTEFYDPGDYVNLQNNRMKKQSQNAGKTSGNGNSVYSVYPNQGNVLSHEWEPITPIGRTELPPFPTDALPGWLRDFVEALAAATETPADLAGMQALAVCALSVAKTAKVALSSNWTEPLNLFVMTVSPPATRKSAVFTRAMAPVMQCELEENQKRSPIVALAKHRYEQLQARYKEASAQAIKVKDEGQRVEYEEQAKQLAEDLAAFSMPSLLRLQTADFTQERLIGLLAENEERLGVMSAEGGIFETLAGHYTGGSVNIDIILKGHSGDGHTYDRKNSPPVSLHNPALTMGLTVQPDVLRGMAAKPAFRGRGMLARWVFSLPPNNVGYRHNRNIAISPTVEAAYDEHIRRLLDASLAFLEQENPKPKLICLDTEAQSRFQQFRGEVEVYLREGERLGDMQDWGGKLCGLVARIAGILHIVETGSAEGLITLRTVEAAIRLGEYFIPHAMAAYGEMRLDDVTDKARSVVEWIQRRALPSFSRRDVHVHHRSRFETVTEIDPILLRLIQQGYIRERTAQKRDGAGQPASPLYEVNPDVFHTQNTQNSEEYALNDNSVYSVYANPMQAAQSEPPQFEPFPVRITATESMQQTARTLAEQRTRAHDATRNPADCNGSEEQNRRIDYFGLLAEVALTDALERHGLHPEGYEFLAVRPPSEPDFTLCGTRFDVKACLPGKEYVSINAGKQENPLTRPDVYACCLFDGDAEFTVVLVPAADVDAWERREGKEKPDGTFRKPYYSKSRNDLSSIGSLDSFVMQPIREEEAELVWK